MPTLESSSSTRLPRTDPDPIESSLRSKGPDHLDSVALLQRAQDGDVDALSRLFEKYQDQLRSIVRVRLGSKLRTKLESMDIVQDAFCVATPRIGRFEHRGPGSLLNWLARIAERQIQDQLSRLQTRKRDVDREVRIDSVLGAIGGPDDWLAAEGPSPAHGAESAELQTLIERALMELAEHHREVIVLRAYCGESWSSIARQLGRSSAHAAEELYRRAGIKLRRKLRPYLRPPR